MWVRGWSAWKGIPVAGGRGGRLEGRPLDSAHRYSENRAASRGWGHGRLAGGGQSAGEPTTNTGLQVSSRYAAKSGCKGSSVHGRSAFCSGRQGWLRAAKAQQTQAGCAPRVVSLRPLVFLDRCEIIDNAFLSVFSRASCTQAGRGGRQDRCCFPFVGEGERLGAGGVMWAPGHQPHRPPHP